MRDGKGIISEVNIGYSHGESIGDHLNEIGSVDAAGVFAFVTKVENTRVVPVGGILQF
jgi:hypothetical protein